MILNILNKLHDAINFHIYHWNPTSCLIEKYRLHFFNRHPKESNFKWPVYRSLVHTWIPCLTTLVFGLRALIFVIFSPRFDTPAKRLAIFAEFLSERGRRSFDTAIMIWSFMHVLYVTYVLRGRLVQWSVLAIFKVHPQGQIQPINVDLSDEEYEKFAKFRQFSARVCDFVCYGISIGGGLGVGFQGVVLNSVLQINTTHAIAWWLHLQLWLFYVCSAAYGLPIFITVISRYIQVKQTSVLSHMRELNQKHQHKSSEELIGNLRQKSQLHRLLLQRYRLVMLCRRYATIQHELRNYSGIVARCLTLILLVYIIIICYLTYSLFVTEATVHFKFIFSHVYAAHITVLTLLIIRCSAITRFNGHLRLEINRFYLQCAKKHLFGTRTFLLFDQISQNLNTKMGFSLVTGFRIDTNAYLAVIYSISIFYFLILKQKQFLE